MRHLNSYIGVYSLLLGRKSPIFQVWQMCTDINETGTKVLIGLYFPELHNTSLLIPTALYLPSQEQLCIFSCEWKNMSDWSAKLVNFMKQTCSLENSMELLCCSTASNNHQLMPAISKDFTEKAVERNLEGKMLSNKPHQTRNQVFVPSFFYNALPALLPC